MPIESTIYVQQWHSQYGSQWQPVCEGETMSRRISVEEHIARGTYRKHRHGPRPTDRPTPAPTTLLEFCPVKSLTVNHRCTKACLMPTADKPEVTEADIKRELAYMARLGWFNMSDPEVNHAAAVRELELRREVYTPAEYRAIIRASFEKRRAGKAPAEY
jgi:hypothetical protein